MKLDAAIYCTFGGGSGGADTASSTAPVGGHPEPGYVIDRRKMQKGGRDKGGVTAGISDPESREFVSKTAVVLKAIKAKRRKRRRMQGTSGGQSEGSSLIAGKYYVVDGQGRVLHTYKTREEAEQASAGNRYSKVKTHLEYSPTSLEDTPEVRDMVTRRPGDTQNRTFRRSLPFPNPLPGSPQGR